MEESLEQLRKKRDELADKLRIALAMQDSACIELIRKEHEEIDRKIRSKNEEDR